MPPTHTQIDPPRLIFRLGWEVSPWPSLALGMVRFRPTVSPGTSRVLLFLILSSRVGLSPPESLEPKLLSSTWQAFGKWLSSWSWALWWGVFCLFGAEHLCWLSKFGGCQVPEILDAWILCNGCIQIINSPLPSKHTPWSGPSKSPLAHFPPVHGSSGPLYQGLPCPGSYGNADWSLYSLSEDVLPILLSQQVSPWKIEDPQAGDTSSVPLSTAYKTCNLIMPLRGCLILSTLSSLVIGLSLVEPNVVHHPNQKAVGRG